MKKYKLSYSPYLYLISFIIILHIFLYFYYNECIFINYNTQITLWVWLIFIFIGYYTQNIIYLLLPPLLLLINELIYINFNKDIFNGGQRTALFYDLTTSYFIQKFKNNTNLTEGLYLKNLHDLNSTMTLDEAKKLNPIEANINKYKRFFIDINIPQDEYTNINILDIGCGNGDFIKYCKTIGINASGLSISKNQVKNLKEQGLDVYLGSYREIQKQFIHKYDIITCWGCLEHITDSYPCSKSGEIKAKNILNKIVKYFKKYYKPNSSYNYFFNTTLHINPNVCGTLNAYLVERAYAGWYFYDKKNETLGDLIKTDFNQIYNKDLTYHYFLATKVDSTHFGRPRNLDLYSCLSIIGGLFINPQIIAILLYSLRGEWVWQFDGKSHIQDESCFNCNFEFNRSKRPTTLLWSLNKLK